MSRRRGILSTALALLAIVALTACAGLPVTGSVNPGIPADEDVTGPDFSFVPERPQPGASPAEIVQGFIRAGTGPGTAGQWARAQLFLSPEYAASGEWRPDANVTIDLSGERVYESTEEGSVDLFVTAVANVDGTGAYSEVDPSRTELSFTLEQQADGEWRITHAPDGIVLDRTQFPTVFHSYSLMYFDQSWSYLVPDVRWYPRISSAAYIAKGLIDGEPSPWLAGSVFTAFPDGVTLAQPAVPRENGIAQVELQREALAADPVVLRRMQAQLEASLATADVSGVAMSVGATVLDVEPAPTRSTRVDQRPLVTLDDDFGFLSGGDIDPIRGLSAVVETVQSVDITVTPDRDAAAVLLADGTVARLSAGGRSDVFDTRANVVSPTVDPLGFLWSVPADEPSALWAFSNDGARIAIADAFPGVASLSAFAVSRDGSRLAAIVSTGGDAAIWVMGIVRDTNGVPQALGAPLEVNEVEGAGIDIAWLDDATLGILSRDGENGTVVERVVGGQAVSTISPATATTIVGGSTTAAVRLRTDDGTLLDKRGANWAERATGVQVLATQQGAPQ